MSPESLTPAHLGQAVDAGALLNGTPQLPRHGPKERFFGGPIPMTWVERAANLPGKAWNLACALWFEALCSPGKSPTVQPAPATLARFGVGTKTTFYRALRALSDAGLVRVDYRLGRPSLVTILPVPSTGQNRTLKKGDPQA